MTMTAQSQTRRQHRRKIGVGSRLRKSLADFFSDDDDGGGPSFNAKIVNAITGNRNWASDPAQATPWVLGALSNWVRLAYVPTIAERIDREGNAVEVDNPLRDLLRSDMSESAYHRCLIDSLFREGFWAVEKIGAMGNPETGSRPKFLNPLKAANLRPYRVDGLDRVTVWRYQLKNGRFRDIPGDAIIHFGEFPDPNRPGRYISRLQALLLTISADYHGRRHNESLMRNGGHMGTIFNYEDASETELTFYKKMSDQMFSGSHKAGGSAHVTGVKSVTDLGSNQKEMDWIKGMHLGREEILSSYGVPLEVTGLGNTTHSNKKQAKKDLWEETLQPLGDDGLIAPHVHALPEVLGDTKVRLNYGGVPALAEDRSLKIRDYRDLIDAGVPSNQAASLTGLPIEIVEPVEPPKPKEEGVKAAPVIDVRQLEFKAVKAGSREAVRKTLWKSIVNEADPHERRIVKELERFFYKQRTTVLRNLSEIAEDEIEGAKAFGAVETKDAREGPDEQELEFAEMLLGTEDYDKLLLTGLSRDLTSVYRLGLDQVDAEQDAVSELAFRTSQDQLLKKVNKTTKLRLALTRGTIQQGILDGLPLDEVVANVEADLRKVFREAQNSRAKTIARTEVGRGLNGGRMDGMKQRGVEMHEWLSSRDSEVRDSHTDIDGRRVRVGSSFIPGGSLSYPQDPNAAAAETINCRCTTIPVVDDL